MVLEYLTQPCPVDRRLRVTQNVLDDVTGDAIQPAGNHGIVVVDGSVFNLLP
jgi:hypothetical protein